MILMKMAGDCRPYQPFNFISAVKWHPYIMLIPAFKVSEWLNLQILRDTEIIYNPDHVPLLNANLCITWDSDFFANKVRYVLGQAEQVILRAGGCQKARMEQQMHYAYLTSSSRWRSMRFTTRPKYR